MECADDYVTLRSGFWWEWKNETIKVLYKQYTINLKNTSFSPTLHLNFSMANHSFIKYPYNLPRAHKCPRKKSCMGDLDSSCAVGYRGPLCEVCSTGYYKQLKICKKCPTKRWMTAQLSIVAAVIVIVTLVVIWTSKKKSEKSGWRSSVDVVLGRLKIVIGFYQVTFGVLEAFSYIKWPDSLALVVKYSEILQLNVFQIAPIHCLVPHLKVDAFGSLFAILALNAFCIIIALLVYGLRKLFLIRDNVGEEHKLLKVSETKELIYRNLFFLLYVTYLSTCSNTANVLPLACHKLCVDGKDQICQEFLKVDYNVQCTGPSYHRSVVVAYCAVVYITFLPTASVIALWRQRRKLWRMNNEEDDETTDPQEKSTEVLTGLRFLFENYNSDSWYWELIETVRKVILTSGLILVGGESRAYIGLACVLSGLYGMIVAYKKPIVDPFENKLMLTSLTVTFVNMGVGAVSRIPQEGISSSIDLYVDNVMFKALVFGANSLVIGLLAGENKTLL